MKYYWIMEKRRRLFRDRFSLVRVRVSRVLSEMFDLITFSRCSRHAFWNLLSGFCFFAFCSVSISRRSASTCSRNRWSSPPAVGLLLLPLAWFEFEVLSVGAIGQNAINLMAFNGKPILECGDRMSGISLLLEQIVKTDEEEWGGHAQRRPNFCITFRIDKNGRKINGWFENIKKEETSILIIRILIFLIDKINKAANNTYNLW